MKRPNSFIIGAPKCGTTALALWLADHPNIFIPKIKEPHFFNTDQRRSITTLAEYEALFRDAESQHLVVGEASVKYLRSGVAVDGILDYQPDARIVVLLRNPVDMAPSLHEQQYFSFQEDVAEFENAWRLQSQRKKGNALPKHCRDPSLLQYAAYCRLGQQVEELLRRVPPRNCHFILLDDLASDPRAVWLTLLQFLGVPDDGRTTFPAINTAKARRFALIARMARSLGQIKVRFIGHSLNLGLLNHVNAATRVERTRAPLSEAMHAELATYFRDEVRLLEQLIQRDLFHWISNDGEAPL